MLIAQAPKNNHSFSMNFPAKFPLEPKCDFCYAQPTVKHYVMKPTIFKVQAADGSIHINHDDGDWFTCSECALLVDANATSELFNRIRNHLPRDLDTRSVDVWEKLNAQKVPHMLAGKKLSHPRSDCMPDFCFKLR